MAGLLDFVGDGWDDPKTQATMALAGGLLSGNFGRGLQGYSDVMAGAKDAALKRQAMQMQMEQHQLALDAARQQQADAAMLRKLRSEATTNPVPAYAGNSAINSVLPEELRIPTMAPAAAQPGGVDLQRFGNSLIRSGLGDPFDITAKLQKDETPITVKEGETLLQRGTLKQLFSNPKTQEMPSAVKEYEYAKKNDGYTGTLQQFIESQKRAGATHMSVNTSDPTAMAKAGMDFQDKYRAATKDSFSRAQAFESMTEASKNPSAKGDLTMVYSMVKALDPTSVVREGEISLLNANRSIPDSIKGYAQRLANGQSLLPKEREDMLNQVKSLIDTDYRRSRNDVKAYRDNAKRLKLDPELYAPDPYAGYEASKSPKITVSAPQQAINMLKMKPSLRDAFDAKYGAGAAEKVLGK